MLDIMPTPLLILAIIVVGRLVGFNTPESNDNWREVAQCLLFVILGMASFWFLVAGFCLWRKLIVLPIAWILYAGYVAEFRPVLAFIVGMLVAEAILLWLSAQTRVHPSDHIKEYSSDTNLTANEENQSVNIQEWTCHLYRLSGKKLLNAVSQAIERAYWVRSGVRIKFLLSPTQPSSLRRQICNHIRSLCQSMGMIPNLSMEQYLIVCELWVESNAKTKKKSKSTPKIELKDSVDQTKEGSCFGPSNPVTSQENPTEPQKNVASTSTRASSNPPKQKKLSPLRIDLRRLSLFEIPDKVVKVLADRDRVIMLSEIKFATGKDKALSKKIRRIVVPLCEDMGFTTVVSCNLVRATPAEFCVDIHRLTLDEVGPMVIKTLEDEDRFQKFFRARFVLGKEKERNKKVRPIVIMACEEMGLNARIAPNGRSVICDLVRVSPKVETETTSDISPVANDDSFEPSETVTSQEYEQETEKPQEPISLTATCDAEKGTTISESKAPTPKILSPLGVTLQGPENPPRDVQMAIATPKLRPAALTIISPKKTKKKILPLCVNLQGLSLDEVRTKVTKTLERGDGLRKFSQVNFVTGKGEACTKRVQDLVIELCHDMGFDANLGKNGGVVICGVVCVRPNVKIESESNITPITDFDTCNTGTGLRPLSGFDIFSGDGLKHVNFLPWAPVPTTDDIGTVAPVPKPDSQSRHGNVWRLDLHGKGKSEAVRQVVDKLKMAQQDGNVSRIEFITGKGLHSKDGIPVLRPVVLRVCRFLGHKVEVNETNEGVVVCDLLPKDHTPPSSFAFY